MAMTVDVGDDDDTVISHANMQSNWQSVKKVE